MLIALAVTMAVLASDSKALTEALAPEAQGNDSRALAQVEALVRDAPTWELPRLEAARLRLKQGVGLDIAEWHVEAARALAPENPRAHYLYGLVEAEKGNPEAARRAFEIAVLLRGDFMDARLRLAQALFNEKDFARAAEQYRAYADKNPNDSASRFQLAAALDQQGKWSDAEKVLKALAQQPNVRVLAWRRLADVLRRAGKSAEAAEYQAKADPPKAGLRPLQPSAR